MVCLCNQSMHTTVWPSCMEITKHPHGRFGSTLNERAIVHPNDMSRKKGGDSKDKNMANRNLQRFDMQIAGHSKGRLPKAVRAPNAEASVQFLCLMHTTVHLIVDGVLIPRGCNHHEKHSKFQPPGNWLLCLICGDPALKLIAYPVPQQNIENINLSPIAEW